MPNLTLSYLGNLARYDKVRLSKIWQDIRGKIKPDLGKIWPCNIKQDLARYDKVIDLARSWSYLARYDNLTLSQIRQDLDNVIRQDYLDKVRLGKIWQDMTR